MLRDLSWKYSQPNPVQIGLHGEFMCVDIALGLKGLALRARLHHGLSRKCFCYRQLVPVAACEALGFRVTDRNKQ